MNKTVYNTIMNKIQTLSSLKKNKKISIMCAALIVLLILFLSMMAPGDEIAYETITVEKGDIKITMKETAEIKAVNYQIVTAPENIRGDLQIIYLVAEGTTVAKGDTLIRFDPSGLLQELSETEDQLDVELANYEKTEVNQKTNLERMITGLDAIKYSHQLSELTIELLKYESEARREEAQLNLKKSEIELEKSKTEINSQKIIDKAELQKVDLKIKQVKAQIRKTKDDIESLTVTAPNPGLIVYQTHGWPTRTKYRVGDKVSRGSWIIRLPDLSKMQAIIPLNEVDRKKIWIGQKGTVYLDAYPGPVFHGEISGISALSKQYKRDSNLKVFEVIFSIDESDTRLKPGMTACVELELETIPNTLSVPIYSIYEKEGKTFVLSANSGKPIEIKTGKMNHTHAIIENGLKENDKIIETPPLTENEKLGYYAYKEKEARRLERLAKHFGNIENLGIHYDYDANRGKKREMKSQEKELSREEIIKMIKEKGGNITPDLLEKLKNAPKSKSASEKKEVKVETVKKGNQNE